jgi:acetyl esterase/lipase
MSTRTFTFAELLALAAMAGFERPSAAADEAPAPRQVAAFERHRDICYCDGAEADKERHLLDVFCPKGVKNFPVVLFVHGGTWKWGDKNLYAGIGEVFAKSGIGFVICNYRLSPKVRHPAHVEDVARAFAWTRENIAKYGGDTGKLFVCGHSAGGHLVSLLATDETYLKAVKRSADEIKGVISISGVYQIVHTEKVFHDAFGKDETICKKASPLTHAPGKHPPFLIAYADRDYEHLDEMAKNMYTALKKAESPCDMLVCKDRTHISIIIHLIEADDPLHQKVCSFIAGTGK